MREAVRFGLPQLALLVWLIALAEGLDWQQTALFLILAWTSGLAAGILMERYYGYAPPPDLVKLKFKWWWRRSWW